MADFYEDMAGVADEMLAPTSEGGLGQTGISLIVASPGAFDPLEPWKEVTETRQAEVLKAAARGATKELDGDWVQQADIAVVAAIPALPYRIAEGRQLYIEISGRTYSVQEVSVLPEAGTPVAVKFIART